jgi:hypothetical protein
LQAALRKLPLEQLVEIVMDLGRFPEARFPDRVVRLCEKPVTHEDLSHVLAHLGDFTDDNRAGIERTLHRISAIRTERCNYRPYSPYRLDQHHRAIEGSDRNRPKSFALKVPVSENDKASRDGSKILNDDFRNGSLLLILE